MEYIEIIKKELPSILDRVEKEIREDKTLFEFIDKDDIDSILMKQKELLFKFFLDYKSGEVDESFCWNFYKELDIPFAIVYHALNSLKVNLLKILLEHISDKSELLQISDFINNLLNMVAKVYIKKDISSIRIDYQSKFSKYLLFKSHIEWIEKLIKAIKIDDLSQYPLSSADNCSFSKYLEYPESLMVCMDANLCKYLHDIHQIIHKNANTLYLFIKRGEYYQAYLAYKELFQNILNFKKTIIELYFLTYNNLEESFFRLVELMLYHQKDINLTLIDIKGLKKLNNNYGEKTINLILEEIEKKLQRVIHKREKEVLLIKGVTADYYMLNIGLNRDELDLLNGELYKIVNNNFEVDSKSIDINSTFVTLYLNGFYEKNRDDLTKIMLYLKDKAKSHNSNYNVYLKEDRDKLLHWLDSSYRDIDFINKKLNNSEIDISFQPIYDIKTGKAEILEALVRIVDNGKLIPAGVFIDTIYSIDKIELLDKLVLKKLIEKRETIKAVAPKLFINVSYKSLLDLDYQETFENFIEEFSGYEVIFELTEQNIVENIDEILKINEKYSLNFAVDDFGSGYSSLKSVSDLARAGVLRVLKMDGEIIKNIDSDGFTQKIVKVISELSSTLELCSVAEFIESEEILELLGRFGVTYAQGYFLSKPKTIDELLVEKLNGLLDRSGTKIL